MTEFIHLFETYFHNGITLIIHILELMGVMIILFGAPCAVSCFAMADAMGGDSQLAASQVVMSTVFSMGTLFVLIYVGKLLAIL